MGSHVFVSHSNLDSAVALELVSFLERYGLNCWLSSRDIRAGQNWAVALDAAIDESKLMIFILSDHSNQDKFQVIRELEEANNRRIPILTYRLGDIVPSHGIRFFVRASQFCDAFNRPGNEVGNDLLDSIDLLMPGHLDSEQERRLQLGGAALPAAEKRHRGIKRSPVVGWVVFAIGACVVIVVLTATLIFRSSSNKVKVETPLETIPEPPADVGGSKAPLVRTLEELAEAGDSTAQAELAMKYANQIQDYEKAFYWAQKSADQGDAVGMLLLAQLYVKGLGVGVDKGKAVEWCKKSAALGNEAAQQLLEILTQADGEDSEQQELQKLASAGDAEAQFKLGSQLLKAGKRSEGVDWVIKAATQKHSMAMCELGTIYYGGMGVEKDEVKAVQWWRQAEIAGNDMARHNLEVYRGKKGSE